MRNSDSYDWLSTGPASSGARRWSGPFILLGACLGALGAAWLLAGRLGWNRDRALWVGFGNLLALLTIVRPWWFWENYKARWLRRLIGDAPTALFYLFVAAAMIWIGVYAGWTFGRR